MKVTAVRLALLRAPLRTPFRTALRTVEAIEDVIVLIETDTGQTGYGEAPPTAVITGDTRESIVSAIRQHIAPLLLGGDVADVARLTGLVQSALERNTSAKAAVEIALYDLFGQLMGRPLYQVLGGGTPSLRTDITISLDAPESMAAEARIAVTRGFDSLKVKLGGADGRDIERVRAVHDAIAGRASLRLDANQAWTPADAVSILQAVETLGIDVELVEQPVPARDIEGLKFVTDHVEAPVMADESVFGPREARQIVELGAADIINIKLMKAGGIGPALAIADIAARGGIHCMMGCMLEAGVSVTAAAHVAAARGDVIAYIDLDGPSLCAGEPVEGGARFDGPTITLPDAPGLGIRALRGLVPLEQTSPV